MFQLIDSPTRVTQYSSTLLDVIITNDKESVTNCGVKTLQLSDHDLVYCTLRHESENIKPFTHTFRDYKDFNHDELNNNLNNLPFQEIYYIRDVNRKVSFLNNLLLGLFDKPKPKAPWLTDNIKLMMKLRDRAKAKFRKTKKNEHWEYYKMLRNWTNHSIEREKRAYFEGVAVSTDPKFIWKE